MLHFPKEMRWTGIAILLLIAIGCPAQSAKSEATVVADPQIAAALQQVSPQRITTRATLKLSKDSVIFAACR